MICGMVFSVLWLPICLSWSAVGKILSALLTPTIGVIATYIAVQQFAINRRQYRLALFEKRMAVFNSTMIFVGAVMRKADVATEESVAFLRDTRDHEFLFGPQVGDFIQKLYQQAIELQLRNETRATGGANPLEIVRWFAKQNEEGKKIFLQYMDFRNPY